eukprot:scaffold1133_cov266-Ochromonas_danica.AAC.2
MLTLQDLACHPCMHTAQSTVSSPTLPDVLTRRAPEGLREGAVMASKHQHRSMMLQLGFSCTVET